MLNVIAEFLRRFGPQPAPAPDEKEWIDQVRDHFEFCQCSYRGRLFGDLIAKCEPHLGPRDCRYHAHTYHRPLPGEYEGGPG